MEYENYTEGVLENLWKPFSHGASAGPTEPLFEEPAEEETEEKAPSLEARLETMEYRLGRALLCLNQCQKEQAELRNRYKELAQEQSASQDRQTRHGKLTRYGLYAAIALIFIGQMEQLASVGWKLFDGLGQLLNAEPEQVSGVLVSAAILWLAVKLGRILIRAIADRRRKEGCSGAVRDR